MSDASEHLERLISRYLDGEGLGAIEETFEDHVVKLVAEADQYHEDTKRRAELLVAEARVARLKAELGDRT